MEDIVAAIDKVIKKRKLDPTTRIINEHIALLEEWEREEASNPGRSEAEREGSLTKLKAKIAELDGPGVIKAYQKESWAESKAQLVRTKEQILGFFTKSSK